MGEENWREACNETAQQAEMYMDPATKSGNKVGGVDACKNHMLSDAKPGATRDKVY